MGTLIMIYSMTSSLHTSYHILVISSLCLCTDHLRCSHTDGCLYRLWWPGPGPGEPSGIFNVLLNTFICRYTWEIALGRHICLKHILFPKCLPKARCSLGLLGFPQPPNLTQPKDGHPKARDGHHHYMSVLPKDGHPMVNS